MTDAAIATAIPEIATQRTASRAFLWVAYQVVAIAILGVIVFEILGWPLQATPVEIAVGISLLPQLITTFNLIRAGRPAPSLLLWLALVIACAVALGMGLWAATRASVEATIIGVISFAWAPAYLAVWFGNWRSTEHRRWIVQGINAISASYVVIVAGLYVLGHEQRLPLPTPWVVLTILALVVVQPLLASLVQAFADKRLPVRPGGRPELKHISGLGTIFLAIFTASIVGLGVWAALGRNGFYIHHEAGFLVAVGLAAAFLFVAIAPNFQTSDRFVRWLRKTPVIRFISGFTSTLDGVLVFAVAGAMGTAQANNGFRYALLISNLVGAGLLGWWLPAPYGIVPIAWAFASTLAVSRRWAWIEEDRENAMLNRKFDGPHIKIGFEQDLRDEALFGFAALLVLVPVALRQAHLTMNSELFAISPGTNINHLIPWVTFFGTELAKAVPFVDWAEIYQVRGNAPISVDETNVGTAQHVIFATRVLVDLVLLATLLQAVSVAQRASKLRDMFYDDRTLSRLDPFVEKRAFRALVVGERNQWRLRDEFPASFKSYDEDRLEELQAKYADDPIGYAAGELLRNQSAELLLHEEAKRETPDPIKLEEYLERAESHGDDIAIGDLLSAHFWLKTRSQHLGIRQQIALTIAAHWNARDAVNALFNILIVPNTRDPRAEVRLTALNGLYVPALNGDHGAQVAIRAALNDNAASVRDVAKGWMDQHPDWGANGTT